MALPTSTHREEETKGALSYEDRIQQAIQAGRADLRKRVKARHEAQRNDPVHQQRQKEREQQKRKRAEESEACKQARKKALKEEAQRLREIEEDRLEESMRIEREKREAARQRLQKKKKVLQQKEHEKTVQMQKDRAERRLKRQHEHEQKQAEMIATHGTMVAPNQIDERARKQEAERRKQAWQRFLLALAFDIDGETSQHPRAHSETSEDARKEIDTLRLLDRLDRGEHVRAGAKSVASCSGQAQDSRPITMELVQNSCGENSLAVCGEHSRDPAVRAEATRFIISVLNEIQSGSEPNECNTRGGTGNESQEDVLGSDILVETDARVDRCVGADIQAAAQALESAVNDVNPAGYRARTRDLVAALRRAPNAGGEARQLLQDIIFGDPSAAIQFASLHPIALLNPSELANREAVERDCLRAATVRLEDEGLPLKVGEEVVCPECDAASPTLQLVGFHREGECILHGTHGGVGARRFAAKCEQCLYSWFHTEG